MKKIPMPNDTDQPCEAIMLLLHELTQSLLIIQTYADTCSQKMTRKTLTHHDLLMLFDHINDQIMLMGNKIHSITSCHISNPFEVTT